MHLNHSSTVFFSILIMISIAIFNTIIFYTEFIFYFSDSEWSYIFIGFMLLSIAMYQQLLLVIQNGYESLYLTQTETVKSNVLSLLKTFLYVFIGLAVAFGNKHHKKLYVLLFVFFALINLIQGARGLFGVSLLFLLWLYGKSGQKKISWGKVAIYTLGHVLI